jgi:hypothetical protein
MDDAAVSSVVVEDDSKRFGSSFRLLREWTMNDDEKDASNDIDVVPVTVLVVVVVVVDEEDVSDLIWIGRMVVSMDKFTLSSS